VEKNHYNFPRLGGGDSHNKTPRGHAQLSRNFGRRGEKKKRKGEKGEEKALNKLKKSFSFRSGFRTSPRKAEKGREGGGGGFTRGGLGKKGKARSCIPNLLFSHARRERGERDIAQFHQQRIEGKKRQKQTRKYTAPFNVFGREEKGKEGGREGEKSESPSRRGEEKFFAYFRRELEWRKKGGKGGRPP